MVPAPRGDNNGHVGLDVKCNLKGLRFFGRFLIRLKESQCGGEERKEIGEDFKKRIRWRRRVKTLSPSSIGATISDATSALFSGDFASAGLACVIRASCVNPVRFWGRNSEAQVTQ
ncbi:hypothetical protein U1Q18_005108 [Sarracenia purpurea var. burkii]